MLEGLRTYPTRFVERIASDQGRFAVKVDEAPGAINESSEQVQAAVATALPRHVPAIVPDLAGAPHVVDQGRRVTVYEDISGGRPPSTTETWYGLGAIVARIHALPPVPRPFAIAVHAAANELERQAADYPFADEFRSLIHRVRRITKHPAATIHGEINLSNVAQRPDGELVLLDWSLRRATLHLPSDAQMRGPWVPESDLRLRSQEHADSTATAGHALDDEASQRVSRVSQWIRQGQTRWTSGRRSLVSGWRRGAPLRRSGPDPPCPAYVQTFLGNPRRSGGG